MVSRYDEFNNLITSEVRLFTCIQPDGVNADFRYGGNPVTSGIVIPDGPVVCGTDYY